MKEYEFNCDLGVSYDIKVKANNKAEAKRKAFIKFKKKIQKKYVRFD